MNNLIDLQEMNQWNINQFCREFDALLELPMDTAEQLVIWEEAAETFERRLAEGGIKIENNEFHEIQHYLIDSDIRFKDKEYRKFQDSQMKAIIKKYRSLGADPDDADNPFNPPIKL